jgi:2-polyprenyl-6-methoxyphenol hydroxylase-like FAD-dependent oxidoreductase
MNEDGVTVYFADGTKVEGSVLLGVEGKNSLTRRTLLGEASTKLNELPVAFTGMTLRLPQAKMQPFLDIDPVLWQGTHPGSGYYVFFSMLSTPESNGSTGTTDEYFEGQFNMSWLLERNGPLPKPEDQIARVKAAAQADTGFFPMLKEAILGIPDDSKMLNLKLEDWPSRSWPCLGGRVALVGDAAHTMTMCKYFVSMNSSKFSLFG